MSSTSSGNREKSRRTSTHDRRGCRATHFFGRHHKTRIMGNYFEKHKLNRICNRVTMLKDIMFWVMICILPPRQKPMFYLYISPAFLEKYEIKVSKLIYICCGLQRDFLNQVTSTVMRGRCWRESCETITIHHLLREICRIKKARSCPDGFPASIFKLTSCSPNYNSSWCFISKRRTLEVHSEIWSMPKLRHLMLDTPFHLHPSSIGIYL